MEIRRFSQKGLGNAAMGEPLESRVATLLPPRHTHAMRKEAEEAVLHTKTIPACLESLHGQFRKPRHLRIGPKYGNS